MKKYINRKYVLIVLISIIGFCTSTALMSYYVITEKYLSVSTIYVVPDVEKHSEALYQNIIAKTELTKDIIEIISIDDVYKSAFEKYESISDKDINYNDFKESIEIKQRPDTRLLDINILSTEPKDAQEINYFIIDEIQLVLNEIYGIELVNVISKPSISSKPVVPKPILYIFVSIIAGLLVGIATVVYIEHKKIELTNKLSS